MGIGAGLALLTALLCLAVTSAREPATISLAELSRLDSPLMSCAPTDAAPDGPLWCSDPSSPHCIPAAPERQRLELADRPDLALIATAPVAQPTFVVVPWPAIEPDVRDGRAAVHPLERPPRA
jgi:hypothetical protein